jgi:ABC-type antimicrobial peptide transport system ATPase subunit
VAEAHAQAKSISASYRSEHAGLKSQISEAKQVLAGLEGDIVERKKAHDAVMASIETLSKRLVGAS